MCCSFTSHKYIRTARPPSTQSANMASRPDTVIYRIIDNNDESRNDEFTVTLRENSRVIVVISRTAYYRRIIPDGGLQLADIRRMMDLFGVRFSRLIEVLNRRQFRGVIGPVLAEMAELNAFFTRFRPILLILPQQQQPPPPPPPQLSALDTAPGGETTCAICLETGADTQNQEWSTAEGCAHHSFHTACIQRWTGGNCPTCRAPWRNTRRRLL